MAITGTDAVRALLKTYYYDKVQNLLFRNSPVLGEIAKARVEGKEQAFSAIAGRGGAVSANFVTAKAAANSASLSKEFKVTPGSLFSSYTMTPGEVQASKTRRGAYMRVAGAKMFAATEGFRQTLAAAFYGSGYGELCKNTQTAAITANTPFTVTMPNDAILKIDVGSILDLKSAVKSSTVKAKFTVQEISGNTVKVKTDASLTPVATDWLCISGCVNSDGTPRLPVGLAGWLPTDGDRTGGDWTSYIAQPFFGVDRSIAPDRLAGNFYKPTATEGAGVSIQKAIMKARRSGSQCNLIVMNDEDFLKFTSEIEASNSFFTATSTVEGKKASTGFEKVSAAFSTNYIENIYDDPYCPKGTFYVLDKDAVELWSFTNTDPAQNGIIGNNPGKADPMTYEEKGRDGDPYGLVIDDYLNVQPGNDTNDGPSTCVSLMFYGSFVVLNPSTACVGKFNYT